METGDSWPHSGESYPAVPLRASPHGWWWQGCPQARVRTRASVRAQADKCVFTSLLPPCSGRFLSFCWRQGELVYPEAGASSSGYKQRQFVGSGVSRGPTGVGEGPRPGHLRPQGATPFSMTPHSRGPISEDFPVPFYAAQVWPPSGCLPHGPGAPRNQREARGGGSSRRGGLALRGQLWPGVGSGKGPGQQWDGFCRRGGSRSDGFVPALGW